MKKLTAILVVLLGLGAGMAAGHFLKTPETVAMVAEADIAVETGEAGGETATAREGAPAAGGNGASGGAAFEYVKLPQQFVVPVVNGAKISAMVVISLSLEVTPGTNAAVFSREPKLRDAFLQVMFAHAHSGGFNGSFTTGQAMLDLRGSLRQSAVAILGDMVNDVLVTDIVRQDTR